MIKRFILALLLILSFVIPSYSATIYNQIQLRRGTYTQWTTVNPIPLIGEPCYETDTGKMKVGDGITHYNSLNYFGGPGVFTGIDSINVSGFNISLIGDTLNPGNSKYYGTNGGGTRGFYTLPSANNLEVYPETYGAKGDGQQINSETWAQSDNCQMTLGNNHLVCTNPHFSPTDDTKIISITSRALATAYYGSAMLANQLPFVTTIASYISATEVTTVANAPYTITYANVIWGTDDTTAITAAIAVATNGTIVFGDKIYIVTLPLWYPTSETSLRIKGQQQYVKATQGAWGGSTIFYAGSAIAYSSPDSTGANGALFRPNHIPMHLTDINIHCNQLCSYGIVLDRATWGDQIHGLGLLYQASGGAGILLDASNNTVGGGLIENITSWGSTPVLALTRISGAFLPSDINQMTFINIIGDTTGLYSYPKGKDSAIYCTSADNNSFFGVIAFGGPIDLRGTTDSTSCTAAGVPYACCTGLNAGATCDGVSKDTACYENYWYHVQGDFYRANGGQSGESFNVENINDDLWQRNEVYGYDMGNGQKKPRTVGGSKLTWTSSTPAVYGGGWHVPDIFIDNSFSVPLIGCLQADAGTGLVTGTGSVCGSGGGLMTWPSSAGIAVYGGSSSWSSPATYSTITALWSHCTNGYLKYDGTCDTPAGGSPSFSSISAGANTTAAMVVGTGSSLGVTGTGSITATALTGNPSVTVNALTTVGSMYMPNNTLIQEKSTGGTYYVVSQIDLSNNFFSGYGMPGTASFGQSAAGIVYLGLSAGSDVKIGTSATGDIYLRDYTGMLKASAGKVSPATSGVDYQAPITNPVKGTGTQYYLPIWTASDTIGALSSIGTNGYVLTSSGAGAAPTWQSFAGGGNVSSSGTPANHYWGVWIDASHIKGNSMTASSLVLTDTNGEPTVLTDVTGGQPLLSGGATTAPAYAGYYLSGTAAQTYTFPATSKTLMATDYSNASYTPAHSGANSDITSMSGLTGNIVMANNTTLQMKDDLGTARMIASLDGSTHSKLFLGYGMPGDVSVGQNAVGNITLGLSMTGSTTIYSGTSQNITLTPGSGGVVSMPSLTLSAITGSTQCLHVNTSGVVSGTGSDCGSSSGANALGYYLVNQSTNAPTNAINLGGLTTGLLFQTVSAGVGTISIKAIGTDVQAYNANTAIGPGSSTAGHLATYSGTDGKTLADGGHALSEYAVSNASTTVNGQTCTLSSTCTVTDSTKLPTAGGTMAGSILMGNGLLMETDTTSGHTFSLAGYTGSTYSNVITVTNAATPTVRFPTISGSTQCLHVSTDGILSGTGSDCGSASGMSNPMTTTGDMIYSSSGSTPARLADVAAGQPLLSGGVSTAPSYAGYTFSGTAAQTYTFPATSKTLMATDFSNASYTPAHSGANSDITSLTMTGSVANPIDLHGATISGYVMYLPNNKAIAARNAGNTADAPLMYLDGSNILQLGSSANVAGVVIGQTQTGPTTIYSGTSQNITLTPGSGGVVSIGAGGSAGHATCWKTDGKTIGYCSSIVAADGTCTCN